MKRNLDTFLCIFAMFAGCALVQAAVPAKINFQGRLLDDMGNPVSGSVTVDVCVFATEAGGVAVYDEAIGSVTVVNGIYSFQFGSDSANLKLALANPEAWLELKIGGTPLAPRKQLVAVPFALVSEVAESVAADGVDSAAIADEAVTTAKLAPQVTPRVTNAAVAPEAAGAGNVGKVFYDTGSERLRVSDGTAWKPAGQRRLHYISTTVANGADNGLLPERQVTFTKLEENSLLRITYCDNLRVVGAVGAATWEVKIDGASIASPNPMRASVYMSVPNVNHHRNSTLIGVAEGVSAGTHTVGVYLISGAGMDSYTGYETTAYLEVEEIPQ